MPRTMTRQSRHGAVFTDAVPARASSVASPRLTIRWTASWLAARSRPARPLLALNSVNVKAYSFTRGTYAGAGAGAGGAGAGAGAGGAGAGAGGGGGCGSGAGASTGAGTSSGGGRFPQQPAPRLSFAERRCAPNTGSVCRGTATAAAGTGTDTGAASCPAASSLSHCCCCCCCCCASYS